MHLHIIYKKSNIKRDKDGGAKKGKEGWQEKEKQHLGEGFGEGEKVCWGGAGGGRRWRNGVGVGYFEEGKNGWGLEVSSLKPFTPFFLLQNIPLQVLFLHQLLS